MKYALTYETDFEDWNTTNTIFFTTKVAIGELSDKEETSLIGKVLLKYGLSITETDFVIVNKLYFVRSCRDIDVEILQ